MIVIVGAGLAGLTCARVLAQAGREVRILETSDGVGGRVRTDRHPDGFLLDRGFQTLFTAYPAAQRHLDLAALEPRAFANDVVVIRGGRWHELADPFRRPFFLPPRPTTSLLPLGDRLRLPRLRRHALRRSVRVIFAGSGPDRSFAADLHDQGFSSHGFIDAYARPRFGGIFLDRQLDTSARFGLFITKMLASGQTIVPAAGMGAIPERLAAGLRPGSVRLGVRVEGVVVAEGRAVGVALPGGEETQGDAIVIATDASSAHRLTGRDVPGEGVAVTCAYFASDTSLYAGPRLLLNADPDAFVNHAVQLSNVALTYAPAGQHLLSVAVIGASDLTDEAIANRCRADISAWFPGRDLGRLRFLRAYRIPFAQFRQPPGIFATLPPNATPTPGLFLAGEYTESSTIHGAMHSGEKAAHAVLEYLRAAS